GQKVDIFQLNSWIDVMSAFPQFIPDEIMALLKELTIDEKHEIIGIVNELENGSMAEPKTVEAAVRMIKQRTPRLYGQLQKINATFTDQFQKLRPATKNKVLEWGKLLFQNFNRKFDDELEAKIQPLKVMTTILNSYKQQSNELKDDFRSVFPKLSALFESDFIKMVINQMQLQLSVAQLIKSG
ncbi:hypothetical protein PMAYCL1PPCAC_10228, partial [Pristionchus mayeri]